MPLCLVWLRTFQLSTWVSYVQTWAQVLTRARGGCVIHRCQNKNPLGMWMTSCTGSARGGFGTFEKVIWVENETPNEKSRLSGLAKARRICALRAPHEMVGMGRWKSQNRKNVYLSPYVEKPLNSKVIKSFVPELRSRECLSCFGILMFYVYMLWTFYVRFTHIRIMGMVHRDAVGIFFRSNWLGSNTNRETLYTL